MLRLRGVLPALLAAASTPALAAGPADRLQALLATKDFDRPSLAARAATDPATVWQLVDPASRAALDLVLALPSADIRRVREGQAVLREARDWSDAETAAIRALTDTLRVNWRKVRVAHVHTVAASVIRVDLELRGSAVGVALAWPAEWAPPRVAIELRAIGADLPPGTFAPLQEGSFEDAEIVALAWETSTPNGARVLRDTARVRSGATSLRLEGAPGGRGAPTLEQRIDVLPGDRLLLTAALAPDGAEGSVGFVFEREGPDTEVVEIATEPRDPELARDSEAASPGRGAAERVGGRVRPPPAISGWNALTVTTTVPADATGARVVVRGGGGGAVNVDDLALLVLGPAPLAVDDWSVTRSGSVVLHADPTRTSDPAALASRLDAAVLAGLGRLSVGGDGTVDVHVFADELHRAAVLRPPSTAGHDDPDAGSCWIVADDPFAAACAIAAQLRRAWGPPGNALLGAGLPRALAGSGVDLHAAVRPSLAKVPSLPTLTGSRETLAAAASFAAWLRDTQSLAAVRAAWQATSLGSYAVAGQDMAALEGAWRRYVGTQGP